jgi:chromate reductase
MTELRILGVAGSLRKASYNRALLRAAQELAPDAAHVEIFDLDGIPLYSGDVEAEGLPARVVEFKQAIAAADALLISTPEYNHGVPGVLKNAIDWASRPSGQSPLADKPTGIVGASPGMGGTVRCQGQLRQTLKALNCHALDQPEYLLPHCNDKFDGNGKLIDAASRDRLRQYLDALRDWTRRLQA